MSIRRALMLSACLAALAGCDDTPCESLGEPCETVGELRCGEGIEECVDHGGGCAEWQTIDRCEGRRCDDSGGEPECACEDRCVVGETSCRDDEVWRCVEGDDGCAALELDVDCAASGNRCDGSSGEAVCVNPCADPCEIEDSSRCQGEMVQACLEQDGGCLGWQDLQDCEESEKVCDDSAGDAVCLDSCADLCEAGERRCSGEVIEACAELEGGCLGWEAGVDCAESGQYCDETGPEPVCVAECVDQCTPGGETRCSGAIVQVCGVQASGCLGWADDVDCTLTGATCDEAGPDAVCVGGCAEPPCEAVEVSCGDGRDNDGDGLTDCDDPSCFGGAACITETNCDDGADNDDDGDADCADADCAGSVACLPYQGLFEVFEAGAPIDLEGWSLLFAPDAAEPMGYEWIAVDGLAAFPVAPGSGTVTATLTLGDSDFEAHALTEMGAFTFYGVDYTSLFVGANGHVTLRSGEGWPMVSVSDLFLQPTIAVLATDLDASDATVTVDETADAVAVTFEGIARAGHGEPNDVQVVLDADGTIELHYLELAAPAAGSSTYVGIARGPGTPPLPGEVDLVTRAPEADCDDGADDDLDGLTDCDDPDCADQPVCAVEGSCANPIVVSSFPFVIRGADFAADFLDRHLLGGAGCLTRPGAVEVVFEVAVEAGQTAVVSERGGLDAVLSLQPGCGDAAACALSADLDVDESAGLTYPVAADGTVHVIVESYFAAPAPADYEIHIGLYSSPHPVINEIAYDDDVTDDAEFVELYFGGGAMDLTGYSLVHVNGSGGTFVWEADLAGRRLGDDGFFVIGPSELAEADARWFLDLGIDNAAEEDVIQNGGSSSEHVGDSLVLYWHYGLPDQAVIDAVEWEGDSAGPGEGTPAAGIVYGSWNNSIGRFPDGADTGDNGADFVTSWWPTPGGPNTAAEPAGYVRLAYSAFGEEATPRLPRPIPDAAPAGVEVTMDGVGAASGYPAVPSTITDLQVGVRITHPYRGDLEVSLTSPAGTTVQLQAGAGEGLDDLEAVWDLYTVPAESLAAFDGQDPRGPTWRLTVADTVAGDTGSIREWVIWVR